MLDRIKDFNIDLNILHHRVMLSGTTYISQRVNDK